MVEQEMVEKEQSQDPEDILMEFAYKRYDEHTEERRSIVENVSIILALDGILIGLLGTIWFNRPSYWIMESVAVALNSIGFCLYVCIGQEFRTLDVKSAWEGLSNDPEVDSVRKVKQKIILIIDGTQKENTNKLQKLWLVYNGAIGALMASLIFVLFSFT
jgi:hypothetical protein